MAKRLDSSGIVLNLLSPPANQSAARAGDSVVPTPIPGCYHGQCSGDEELLSGLLTTDRLFLSESGRSENTVSLCFGNTDTNVAGVFGQLTL